MSLAVCLRPQQVTFFHSVSVSLYLDRFRRFGPLHCSSEGGSWSDRLAELVRSLQPPSPTAVEGVPKVEEDEEEVEEVRGRVEEEEEEETSKGGGVDDGVPPQKTTTTTTKVVTITETRQLRIYQTISRKVQRLLFRKPRKEEEEEEGREEQGSRGGGGRTAGGGGELLLLQQQPQRGAIKEEEEEEEEKEETGYRGGRQDEVRKCLPAPIGGSRGREEEEEEVELWRRGVSAGGGVGGGGSIKEEKRGGRREEVIYDIVEGESKGEESFEEGRPEVFWEARRGGEESRRSSARSREGSRRSSARSREGSRRSSGRRAEEAGQDLVQVKRERLILGKRERSFEKWEEKPWERIERLAKEEEERRKREKEEEEEEEKRKKKAEEGVRERLTLEEQRTLEAEEEEEAEKRAPPRTVEPKKEIEIPKKEKKEELETKKEVQKEAKKEVEKVEAKEVEKVVAKREPEKETKKEIEREPKKEIQREPKEPEKEPKKEIQREPKKEPEKEPKKEIQKEAKKEIQKEPKKKAEKGEVQREKASERDVAKAPPKEEPPHDEASRALAHEIVRTALEQGALAVSEGIYVSDRLLVSPGDEDDYDDDGEEHIYEVPADLVREAQLHLLVLRGGRRALTPSPGQEEGRKRRKEDVVLVRRLRKNEEGQEEDEGDEEELVSVVRRSRTDSVGSSVSEGSVRRVSRVVNNGGEEAAEGGGGGDQDGGGGGEARVKNVRRVVRLTQAQWRRLQGSVGSLTTALRSRYHNLRRLQHPPHQPHHHHHQEEGEEARRKDEEGEAKEEEEEVVKQREEQEVVKQREEEESEEEEEEEEEEGGFLGDGWEEEEVQEEPTKGILAGREGGGRREKEEEEKEEEKVPIREREGEEEKRRDLQKSKPGEEEKEKEEEKGIREEKEREKKEEEKEAVKQEPKPREKKRVRRTKTVIWAGLSDEEEEPKKKKEEEEEKNKKYREKELEKEREEREKLRELEREKERERERAKEREREREKEEEEEEEEEKEEEKEKEVEEAKEKEKTKGGATWKRRSWREASLYNKRKRESELADKEVSEILEKQLQEEEEDKEEKEEKRKKEEEEKRKKEEEEKRKKEEEEKRKKEEEEKRKKEEEEKRKKEEEEKRKKEEEEKRKKEEEEERKRLLEEKRKKEAEEERKRLLEEKRKKEAEEERKRLLEEKRKKEAEEERKRILEEKRRKEEEEERKRILEEKRKKEEEEKKRKEEEERKRILEEKRKKEEEERKRILEEKRKKEEEEERQRILEEKRKREEEEERKRKEEEERQRKILEEQKKREEEEERERQRKQAEKEEEEERRRNEELAQRKAKKEREERIAQKEREEQEAAEKEREERIAQKEREKQEAAEKEREEKIAKEEREETKAKEEREEKIAKEEREETKAKEERVEKPAKKGQRQRKAVSPAPEERERVLEDAREIVHAAIEQGVQVVNEGVYTRADEVETLREEEEEEGEEEECQFSGCKGDSSKACEDLGFREVDGELEVALDEPEVKERRGDVGGDPMSRRLASGGGEEAEGEPAPKRPVLGEVMMALTTTPATPSPSPTPSPLPSPTLTASPSLSISMNRKMFCQGMMMGGANRRRHASEGGEDDAEGDVSVSEGDAQKIGFVYLAVAQQQQQQPFERTESMIAMKGSRDEDAEDEDLTREEDLTRDESLTSEVERLDDEVLEDEIVGDDALGYQEALDETLAFQEVALESHRYGKVRVEAPAEAKVRGEAAVEAAKVKYELMDDEQLDATEEGFEVEEMGVEAEEYSLSEALEVGEKRDEDDDDDDDKEDPSEQSEASGVAGQYSFQQMEEEEDEEEEEEASENTERRGSDSPNKPNIWSFLREHPDAIGDDEDEDVAMEEEVEAVDGESCTSFEGRYDVALEQELYIKARREEQEEKPKGKGDIEITMEDDVVICTQFITGQEAQETKEVDGPAESKIEDSDGKANEKGGEDAEEVKEKVDVQKEVEEGEEAKEEENKDSIKVGEGETKKGEQQAEKGEGGVAQGAGGPQILITAEVGESAGSTSSTQHPAHHQQSTPYSSSTLAAHLAAHPRPPTPKSPITVDEWVAALPHPTSVDDEGDAWTCSDPGGEEVADDLLNLGAEAGLLAGPGVLVTSAEGEVQRRGNLVASVAPSSMPQPTTVVTGPKDAPSSPRLRGPPLSPLPASKFSTSPSPSRPLTHADVASTLQRQHQEQQEQADGLGVEGRRSQFAALREKQASFQSELSGLSFQSKSSIDSLLESREADPVDVLLNLGFGGTSQDTLSRVPERFLRPSQVPGNNLEEFLRSEEEFSDMMELAEWVPSLDPQAFRRASVATMSPLMRRLLDTIRDSRSFQQGSISEDTSSAGHTPVGATPPSGVSKFAATARAIALKNTVMQNFAQRPNKLSVLSAESRRLIDLQNQKSPEVPRKRLIIGQSSFELGRDGQLIAIEDEGVGVSLDQDDDDDDSSDDSGASKDDEAMDGISDEAGEKMEEGDELEEGCWRRHGRLQHKDSVWSMASSATSIDSSEEEIREQRHRLQLSLSRRPLQPDPVAPGTPTTPAESLDSPQPVFTSGTDSSDRYRKIMRRLSGTKRHSTVSSGGSWEMDERIPEEDHEDDLQQEPLQDQVICEADASGSLNSCSDTRASVASASPNQKHSSSTSLSPHSRQNSRSQGTSLSPPVSANNRKASKGDSSSSQNGLEPSAPLLSFSQHAHNPSLIQPVPILLQHTPMPLPRTGRTGDEAVTSVQRGGGCMLRRQQRVDDGYIDPGSPQALHPSTPPQNCRHQVRGPGNEDERTGVSGPICRSGSAQSDSSGFMDGDVAEGEARTPTQHNLSSGQLSSSPLQTSGHSWWWSRDSGGSQETVRHAPLARTFALRAGLSHSGGPSHSHPQRPPLRSHPLSLQTSPPSSSAWPRGTRVPALYLDEGSPSLPSGESVRTPASAPAALLARSLDPPPFPFQASPWSISAAPSTPSPPSCSHAPCVDTSIPPVLHPCRRHHLLQAHSLDTDPREHRSKALHSQPFFSHSLDSTFSAFHHHSSEGLQNPPITGHPQCSKCREGFPASPAVEAFSQPLTTTGWDPCDPLGSSERQSQFHSSLDRRRKRHSSLPEPLPSIVHSAPPSPPLSSPQSLSESPWVAVASEVLFAPPAANREHLAASEGSARDIKLKDNSRQCEAHSLPSDMLLVALHSYRHQLVHQEHLSRQLHDTAMDMSDTSVNTQQLSQQLRNISAIRAAIRAEVTHMEQLMASTQHSSLSPTCINTVVTQMVLLLQQQSELCRDLETLTVSTTHSSRDSGPPSSQQCSDSSLNGLVVKKDATTEANFNPKSANPLPSGPANWKVTEDPALARQGLGFVAHSLEKAGIPDHSKAKSFSPVHPRQQVTIPNYSVKGRNIPGSQSDSDSKVGWTSVPQVLRGSEADRELNNNNLDTYLSLGELTTNGSGSSVHSASLNMRSSSFSPQNSVQDKDRPQGSAKSFDTDPEEGLEGIDLQSFLAGDVSSDTSSLASQVAQLVQEQVQKQTQVLEDQLHQQTKDMADLKNMMQILISKIS